jgi:2-dehydropantoate 2-reductase
LPSSALTAAGRDVTLCVRTLASRLVLEQSDRTIEPAVRIVTDPADVGPVPWVVLTTKAQDTPGAQPWLDRLVGDHTTVAVLQNGVDHEKRVSAPRVLPALAYVVVERVAPGRIRQFTPGRLVVPSSGQGFQDLFGDELPVALTEDFRTEAWRKLFGNSAGNPITALTLRRVAVLQDKDVHTLAVSVLRESIEVGIADGAKVDMAEELAGVQALWDSMDPAGGSSMLYDRLAGQHMEHEYITGAVVHYADKYGVPAPINRVFLTLLRALDAR